VAVNADAGSAAKGSPAGTSTDAGSALDTGVAADPDDETCGYYWERCISPECCAGKVESTFKGRPIYRICCSQRNCVVDGTCADAAVNPAPRCPP
jgi:hypothetical protein